MYSVYKMPIIKICNVLSQQLLNRNTERDDAYETPHLGSRAYGNAKLGGSKASVHSLCEDSKKSKHKGCRHIVLRLHTTLFNYKGTGDNISQVKKKKVIKVL